MERTEWWKRAVVYQIYPRSFQDSNSDGIGDIPGIISRLDYLSELGVDAIWLSPVYDSPNDDNGYDIRDYRAIMSEFGTMSDMDHLIEQLHKRKMKLIMDLVVNHCSDEHEWFREARTSRENPYHDWFIWHPGRGLTGPSAEDEPIPPPPNNWRSFFQGSVWEWNEPTREYYLHLFSKKQPDLNWENRSLRSAIYDMMHFWLKRGVDGFRMDVINFIGKPEGLPDAPNPEGREFVFAPEMVANLPRTHEHLQEMHREVLSHYDCMTVGEMHQTDLSDGILYVDPSRQELDMIFQFEHMYIDNGVAGKYDIPRAWTLPELKTIVRRWQTGIAGHGWNSIFTGNHDSPRVVSRYGNDGGASGMEGEWDDDTRRRSATAIACAFYLQQGTPFIYQGEEIGMTNVSFPSADYYRDIESVNFYRNEMRRKDASPEHLLRILHLRSRDNSRTPMQWSSDTHAGFTDDVPWLSVNPNFTNIHVKRERSRPDGIYAFYRELISLRKSRSVFDEGEYVDCAPDDEHVFAYRRDGETERVLVIVNFGNAPSSFPVDADVARSLRYGLLSNRQTRPEGLPAEDAGGSPVTLSLQPWEAFVSSDTKTDSSTSTLWSVP